MAGAPASLPRPRGARGDRGVFPKWGIHRPSVHQQSQSCEKIGCKIPSTKQSLFQCRPLLHGHERSSSAGRRAARREVQVFGRAIPFHGLPSVPPGRGLAHVLYGPRRRQRHQCTAASWCRDGCGDWAKLRLPRQLQERRECLHGYCCQTITDSE